MCHCIPVILVQQHGDNSVHVTNRTCSTRRTQQQSYTEALPRSAWNLLSHGTLVITPTGEDKQLIGGMEAKFNSAEEVARFQHLFTNELVDVRKDIRSPKTCSNNPMDKQLPCGDVMLMACCITYAVGKQLSIPLISLGRKGTLKCWWWIDYDVSLKCPSKRMGGILMVQGWCTPPSHALHISLPYSSFLWLLLCLWGRHQCTSHSWWVVRVLMPALYIFMAFFSLLLYCVLYFIYSTTAC